MAADSILSPRLLFRTDAGLQMGTGHVMRCLALAQAWQNLDGFVAFAFTSLPTALKDRLENEEIELHKLDVELGSPEDAQITIQVATKLNARWVVIDGYQFDDVYQHIIKDTGLNILFLDDYGHCDSYSADLILNQNLSASASIYRNRSAASQLLLSTPYTLLRREFWTWQAWDRPVNSKTRNKLLITLGGSDAENVTQFVLESINQINDKILEVIVLVGGVNPHYDLLAELAAKSSHQIKLNQNVTDMCPLLAWADIVISAGGSTCWEMAFMGLPNLILVLAENQAPIANALDELGVSINLGFFTEVTSVNVSDTILALMQDDKMYEKMSQIGRQIVDGQGAQRVIKRIRYHLQLREATEADVDILFQWANDPQVRESSFNSKPIKYDQHVSWFQKKISGSNSVTFIGINDKSDPVAQIRFDIDPSVSDPIALISMSVAPSFRGYGYGGQVVTLGVQRFRQLWPAMPIHALVKVENLASMETFRRASFQLLSINRAETQDYDFATWSFPLT